MRSVTLIAATLVSVAFLLAGCSSSQPVETAAENSQSSDSSSASASEGVSSPSETASEATPAPEESLGIVRELTSESLFDAMPGLQDAEDWGLRDLRDFVNNGENANQIVEFDSIEGALAYMISDGDWSRVKPSSCEPVQALAYPPLDSDAVLAGVAAFTDSPDLGPSFAQNMAFVQVTVWPSVEQAQIRFEDAAAVADECGAYTVLQGDSSYSATRWDGSPKLSDTSIVGATDTGLGTAMGVAGTATYSVVVVNKKASSIVEKANDWVQQKLVTAQKAT